MKKIAIVGAHGSGKRYLCDALHARCAGNNYTSVLVNGASSQCPLPIYEKQNANSTLWICCKQIQMELEAELHEPDFIICNKSIIDHIIYLLANDQKEVNSDIVDFAESYLKTYDKIYLIRPTNKTTSIDGSQIADKEFQYIIYNIFTHWLAGQCEIILPESLRSEEINNLCKHILGF
jgi:hypothetical protein